MRPTPNRPIIIGGGPAGSASAIMLARGGVRPLLFEKNATTGDAICGGFLSWQSLARLRDIGITPDMLGGHMVTRVRLFCGERSAETRLPGPGLGVSRYRLDSVMLAAAQAAGAQVERPCIVRAVAPGSVTLSDGTRHDSNAIILANGKYGMAGQPRRAPEPAASDPVVGLRMRIAAHGPTQARIGDAVELFLFDRGYAGLVLQEDGSANLCLAVHKSRLTEAGGQPAALIRAWGGQCGPLGERIGQLGALPAIDAIAAIPYGWYVSDTEDGLWRVGDQAACIPSLAGEGMGIALNSAMSAARALLDGRSASHWQRHMAARLRRPMWVARAAWRVTETPPWNEWATGSLRYAPWLVRMIAGMTRIPA